jgi:hypothetical protein
VFVSYESLNSDYHQIHQYQQNKKSPLIFTEHQKKKTMAYDIGNSGPGLEVFLLLVKN